jgi:excisionase family DNA binding protein
MDELLVTVEGGARRIHLGRSKMYELIASGEIESVRIGKARRIPIAALEAYVARLRREQSPHKDGALKELDGGGAGK